MTPIRSTAGATKRGVRAHPLSPTSHKAQKKVAMKTAI